MSVTAAALGAGMLLTGCGSPPAPETTRTVTSAATKAPKTVPNVTGKTFGEAHDLLVASGIIYVAVGSDGAKFTDTPPRTAVVAGAHPGVWIEVPGGTVTLKIKGSEKDLVAKSAAAKAKSAAEASAVASLSSRTDACDRPSSCGACTGGLHPRPTGPRTDVAHSPAIPEPVLASMRHTGKASASGELRRNSSAAGSSVNSTSST